MSIPEQQEEPLRPPLLQTALCHASFITCRANLMADHADQLAQLSHLGPLDLKTISRVSLCKPEIMYDGSGPLGVTETGVRINGDAAQTTDPQSESGKLKAVLSIEGGIPKEHKALFADGDEGSLLTLVLPSAPIFSFDENGDILRRVGIFTPSDARPCDALRDPVLYDGKSGDATRPLAGRPDARPRSSEAVVAVDDPWRHEGQFIVDEVRGPSITESSCRQFTASLGDLESLPNIDDAAEEVTETEAKTVVSVVSGATRAATANAVPRIDFHAASIEVVDDYLEDHLEESQLKDLCSTILGDAGWQDPRCTSSRRQTRALLSTISQESSCSRRQRVPFHTVVFSERKPSTGDALVQSLGLSADGANTIQDIASKNQGAARERLQQGEVVSSEPKLTRHCKSCGESPDDCLKKLGLHADDVRSLSPSPKSERLLPFFQNIQTKMPRPNRSQTPYVSDPELDQVHQATSKPNHSRSLTSSPTQQEEHGRKSKLSTV